MKRFLIKLIALIIILTLVFLTAGCAADLARLKKDLKSANENGLDRKIEIYSVTGQLIKTYEGKFDLMSSKFENEILFEMNGKRYIIRNAIVIVEEK